MPMKVTAAAGGEVHANPFIGPIGHPVSLRIDVSALTANMVDQYGYLKPGVLVQASGVPVNGVTQIAYGAVIEATKVADNNGAALATAPDIDVAVGLWVLLNRDILEDLLGRVLSADELAAINAAGSHVAVTPT